MDVLLLYNEPVLPTDHPDAAAEAGVLDSVASVTTALSARGHDARQLAVGPSLEGALEQLTQLKPPDVVFNLFEGLSGVGRGEAELTGLIELLGYPITGSPAQCLGLVRDKARTKWMLAGAGLPTAEFVLLQTDDAIDHPRVRRLLVTGPVIVKPAHEDASQGITDNSIVCEWKPLVGQVEAVRSRYGAVLVERFVPGREFNAAVVSFGHTECLPLAEIEFCGDGPPGWQIVTYDAKWNSGSAADRQTPARCPARVETETAQRIGQIARAAFDLTACRDYARVDMRMDEQGQVYILEVNGNPDIGPGAGFARALAAGGIAYEEFVDRLIRNASARHGARPSCAEA